MASLGLLTFNVYAGEDFQALRLDAIAEEVARFRPDVICLQEATPALCERLQARLPGHWALLWSKSQALKAANVDRDIPGCRPESLSEEERQFLETGKCPWKDGQELSELIMLARADAEVLERELVHAGNWLDDGQLRVRLRLPSEAAGGAPLLLDVYNIHFVGGTFGKAPEVVLRKREERSREFQCLRRSLKAHFSEAEDYIVVVAGDFNSDADQPSLFPEVDESPEFSREQLLGSLQFCEAFCDASKGTGATESSSRNGFREWLKPGQNREVRFDRILCGRSTHAGPIVVETVNLVGTACIGEAASDRPDGAPVPLWPSDHFGVFVRVAVPRGA